jgi:uncharacterized protein (DUF433 family)
MGGLTMGENSSEARFSRRAVFTAAGATIAGTALAVVPLVEALSAESNIHALLHRLRELEKEVLEASEHADNLKYERNRITVDPPEALKRRKTDHPHFCGVDLVDVYGEREIISVRVFRMNTTLPDDERPQLEQVNRILTAWNLQTDRVSPIEIRPGDLERADEILAAWELWQAQIREARRSISTADAETLVNHLDEQIVRVRDLIIEHPDKSLPALAIKARVAAEWNDGDWFLEIAADLDALVAAA